MVLGVKMAEIFEKNTKSPIKKTRKTPLESVKMKKIKNRASSCLKLAQMTPEAKMLRSWDFWWLTKTWTNTYTKMKIFFICIDARFCIFTTSTTTFLDSA